MPSFPLPPWLSIDPSFFTQALESGARTGLAVADQNQRAQQMAEQRAERQAALSQRQDEESERQRQFDESHLLNVQKVAQDAAQLQQQIAHQTAQEANQSAQESRLLRFQQGQLGIGANRLAQQAAHQGVLEKQGVDRLGIMQQQADTAKKRADNAIDPLAVSNRARVGTESKTASGLSFVWTGPNQIRVMTKDGEQKDMTPGQLQAYAKDAAFSPDPTNKAMALEIERFLGEKAKAQIGRQATNAPTVLAPASTNALAGRITRNKDGKLEFHK